MVGVARVTIDTRHRKSRQDADGFRKGTSRNDRHLLHPWVVTKISVTIIDFGQPLLTQLPPQASEQAREQPFDPVIAL